ncbi:MAG TPA: chaperone modulator CbpM [Chloroflexota bacterium]|nr:chaperone modulator CbpM [Chloroflexota bacterium]
MTPEPVRYYTIEMISRQTRVSPALLRRYARLGIVAPSARRGRTALYREEDIARLRKVVRLTRDLGINLAGVEVILRLTDEIHALRRELAVATKEEK